MNPIISSLFEKGMTFISQINPTLASKIRYRRYLGKKLDLDNPRTLNEKMMYLKLNKYWNQQFVADRADKYAVRSVIKNAGCPETLQQPDDHQRRGY